MDSVWYKSKVSKGLGNGRKISLPTLNLDPNVLPTEYKKGVYATTVTFHEDSYEGALYFGPRTILNETHDVLEIYLLRFSQDIYNEYITFCLHSFIRSPITFLTFEELKNQLHQDIMNVQRYFSSTHG